MEAKVLTLSPGRGRSPASFPELETTELRQKILEMTALCKQLQDHVEYLENKVMSPVFACFALVAYLYLAQTYLVLPCLTYLELHGLSFTLPLRKLTLCHLASFNTWHITLYVIFNTVSYLALPYG